MQRYTMPRKSPRIKNMCILVITMASTLFMIYIAWALKCTFFWHTRYGIQCLISGYTYRVGQYCKGNGIGSYATFRAAATACSNNVECGCIYDKACDGVSWFISKGYEVTPGYLSSVRSCAWTPSKLTLPFHTRKLIYFTYNNDIDIFYIYTIIIIIIKRMERSISRSTN